MLFKRTTSKFILFIVITLLLGCAPKESDAKQSKPDVHQSDIRFFEASDIKDCTLDHDDINFCTPQRLKSYNEILKNKITNFDDDKYLTTIQYNNAIYFLVIDFNKEKVYSFPASIRLLKNETLNFDKKSNKICFKGDYLEYRNTYTNVSSCFIYLNGSYENEFMDDLNINHSEINNMSLSLTNDNVKTIKLPSTSNYISKCAEKKSRKECETLAKEDNYPYLYSYTNGSFFDSGSNLEKFFSQEKIKNKIDELHNIDVIRFIPNDKELIYAIAMKQIEYGDEDLKQNYYLLKLNPEFSIIPLGEEYVIDENHVLYYKDVDGITKKILVK